MIFDESFVSPAPPYNAGVFRLRVRRVKATEFPVTIHFGAFGMHFDTENDPLSSNFGVAAGAGPPAVSYF